MTRGSDARSWSAIRKRLSAHFAGLAAHTTSAELIRSNQEFLNTLPNDDDLPLLPASEVTYQDLKDMFDLYPDLERDLVEIPDAYRLCVPENLERGMNEELGSLAYGPEKEGGSYFHTSTLLSHCLREEQHFAAHNLSPYSPILTPKTHLDLEVSHKGMRKTLTAGMDYSIRFAED
ncbi:hypothetical protein BJY00DRAFT_19407 [Aspergillus carlsbadensis]|nr:hypothetical protein BJY00DRAFT_19407 [Aspergillus carlsbadensis]